MSDITQNLGNRIKLYRKEYKISQEELAFKSSISTTYLGQIERAEKSPTIDILSKIASALDVSLAEFFQFEKKAEKAAPSKTIDKINNRLALMSEKEQTEILKIIKNIQNFKKI